MDTQIDLTSNFQQKMFERIRDSIGELMSEDDLKKMVAVATEKAFFEPRTRKDNYGRVEQYKDSIIVEELRKLLSQHVETAVRQWIEEHPEAVNKAVGESISKGMYGMIISYMESKMYAPLQE